MTHSADVSQAFHGASGPASTTGQSGVIAMQSAAGTEPAGHSHTPALHVAERTEVALQQPGATSTAHSIGEPGHGGGECSCDAKQPASNAAARPITSLADE